MKNLTKLFCLLFVGQLCIGQPTSLSELRPKYTVPIKKEIKEEPLVYSVNEVSFEKTITADIVPILNKDYTIKGLTYNTVANSGGEGWASFPSAVYVFLLSSLNGGGVKYLI